MKKYKGVGAIFCGGKSTRMGVPKAGIVLPDGRTIVDVVYQALNPYCSEIVLVGHGEGVPDNLKHLRQIEDQYQGKGPIGGLEALLRSDLSEEYLIAPCDLFRARENVFQLLINYKDKLPVVLRSKERIEPLIGRYPANLLALVQAQITRNQFAMHDLISLADAMILSVPEECEDALSNANTPEDLLNKR